MARERTLAACVVVLVGLLIASRTAAQAAPSLQGDEPSPAPTSQETQPAPTSPPGRLGTVTPFTGTPGVQLPTPTLQPPPGSGGRVAVEALYVRDEPAFGGNVVGIIPYGQSIYPVGRNGDGSWIAINWASARGWVYAEMVSWDPALDLNTLPILVQSTGVPPTPTPGNTPTPPETQTPTPSLTPVPPPTSTAPSAPATPTRAAAVAPTLASQATSPPPATAIPSAPPSNGGGLPANVQLPLFGGLGVLVLAGLVYFWQWSAGRSEVKRYAKGFVLSICPVCQEGHIHLDEVVRTAVGIQWVRRSARCDTCNSVLREMRPGVWRYSVDAFANPQLAERFKDQRAMTAELQELARNIVLRPSSKQFDEPTAESLNLSWLEIDEPLGSDQSDAETSADSGAEGDQAEEPAS